MLSQHDLTDAQRRAVEIRDRPVAVIAGAGSGKTTVLVNRYLKLISDGLRPSQILAVTFTNAASDELRSRIARQLKDVPEFAQQVSTTKAIGTLHSFCRTVLTSYGQLGHLPAVESVVDDLDVTAAFRRLYAEWLGSLGESDITELLKRYRRSEIYDLAVAFYQGRWALSSESNSDSCRLVKSLSPYFAPLNAAMSRELYEKGRYDFNDLEHATHELLRSHRSVRLQVQEEYRAILVDEFQDTSPIQWKIIQSAIGDHWERLFVVGDPKQSIYRFRGAVARQFFQVAHQMKELHGEVIPMETNFRATSSLVEQINGISLSLFAGSDIPFSPMDSPLAKAKDGANSSALEWHLIPGQGKRGEFTQREADYTAQTLKQLFERGIQPKDCAILFRAADPIAAYSLALQWNGIPFTSRQTRSLFSLYDINDLFAYLMSVANPFDDYWFSAFLRSPYLDYSPQELQTLSDSPGATLFEKAKDETKIRWFQQLLETGERGLSDCLTSLFRHTEYWPKQEEIFFQCIQSLRKGTNNLFEAIQKLESWKRSEVRVSAEVRSGLGEGVQLMTVHASKGLEFEHVFLVDLVKRTPAYSPLLSWSEQKPYLKYRHRGEWVLSKAYEAAIEQDRLDSLYESKRILYVALTRARKHLHLVLPENEKLIPKDCWAEWLLRARRQKADLLAEIKKRVECPQIELGTPPLP